MDLFAPGTATTMILLGFRTGGVVLVAPVFASRTVPPMVRAGLVVVLTVLLHPVATKGAVPAGISPAAAITETLIGFAIGLGAAVLVGAMEAMGDLLAVQIGLSGAAALDPMTNASVPVLGQMAHLFAITLLLALDGHLVMLRALADSLALLPVGGELNLAAAMAAMVAQGSTLFVLGLTFAAPVVAAVLLANVALAVLGRAAPQLNVITVAFPIQIGLGLFVFASTIPLIGAFFTGWVPVYDGMLGGVLAAFLGGR